MKKAFALLLVLALLLAGCATQTPPPSPSPTEAATDTATPTEATQDDRGIKNMSAFTIRTIYSHDPFAIPYADDRPAPEEATEVYAAACDASVTSDTPYGEINYDYAFTMDSDGDVISGTVGVTSGSVSASSLKNAADLYFYTLLLCADVDSDTASDLVSTALENVSTEGYEFTTDKAKFTIFWNSKNSYWLSVEKAA